MTNTEKLRSHVKKSGLKLSYIAKTIGLTRAALYNKITNRSEFKASEIDELCRILNITSYKERESIFFAEKVDDSATFETKKRSE